MVHGWYPLPACAHWPRWILRILAAMLAVGCAVGIWYAGGVL